MKKALMIGLIAAGSLIPALSNAIGSAYAGFVTVNNSSTGVSSMYGTMNNRYNTSPTSYITYLRVYGAANSNITFDGGDGEGDYFYCYVLNSSSLYEAAVAIKNGISNSSLIYVTKNSSSNECAYLYEGKYSSSQD